MPHEPAEELQRVQVTYATIRPSEIGLYALAVVLLGIISLFRQVDWFFFAGILVAAGAWELTKLRLRRNVRRFIDSSR